MFQADYTFVDWAGTEEEAKAIIVNHIKASKDIYEVTDFDGDGTPEGTPILNNFVFVLEKNGIISNEQNINQQQNIIVSARIDC